MYEKYFGQYRLHQLETIKDLRKTMTPFQLGQMTALSLRHLSPNTIFLLYDKAEGIGSRRSFIAFLDKIKNNGGHIPLENYVYKRIALDDSFRDEFISGFIEMAKLMAVQRIRSVIKI